MQNILKLGGLGNAPRKILKISCFEIDSGSIFTYKKQLSFCQSSLILGRVDISLI